MSNGQHSNEHEHHALRAVPKQGWIVRKEINVSTVIAFVAALAGGIMAFATLRADVQHKADDADVRVIENRVDNVEEDISEIKEGISELLRRSQ